MKKERNKKTYFAVSGDSVRDELYYLTPTKVDEFEKLFGSVNSPWDNHNESLDWVRGNAKYIGECACVSYE